MSGDRPDIIERYVRATQTTDLTIRTDGRTDADLLLASGFAASHDRKGMAALRAYRLRVAGDMTGRREMVEEMIDWTRSARIDRRQVRITRPEARLVAKLTLAWWLYDSCPVCKGRAFKLIPDTPSLSLTPCDACRGTGKRSIPAKIPFERRELAKWLFAELDRLVSFIIAEMAKKLRGRLELG